MTPGEVAGRLERLTGTGVRDLQPAGSAHRWHYYRAALADGRAVFAKVAAAGPAGLFDAEARGLAQPAQAARFGIEQPGQPGRGDLGEYPPAVGQRRPEVVPPVGRPGGPQVADAGAGEALEARGYFAGRHVRSCAGMPGSAASSSASPVVAARTRSNASA